MERGILFVCRSKALLISGETDGGEQRRWGGAIQQKSTRNVIYFQLFRQVDCPEFEFVFIFIYSGFQCLFYGLTMQGSPFKNVEMIKQTKPLVQLERIEREKRMDTHRMLT